MKSNQYKVTIYRTQKEDNTNHYRLEIWWYENRPNPVTGKVEKLFQWFSSEDNSIEDLTDDIRHFFWNHFEEGKDAYWPLTADSGKEPKRDKNNQTDFQF